MIAVEVQILPFNVFGIFVKIVQGAADDGAEPAVSICFGIGFIVNIHIKTGGNARRKILHDTESGQIIYAFITQFCFIWPYDFA